MDKKSKKEKIRSPVKNRRAQNNQTSSTKLNQQSKSIQVQKKIETPQITEIISLNHSTQQTSQLLEKSLAFPLKDNSKLVLNKKNISDYKANSTDNKKNENKINSSITSFMEVEREKKNLFINEKNSIEEIKNLTFDPLTLFLYSNFTGKKRKIPFSEFNDIGNFIQNIKNDTRNKAETQSLNINNTEKNKNNLNNNNKNNCKNNTYEKNNHLSYEINNESFTIFENENNETKKIDSLKSIENKNNNIKTKNNNEKTNKNIFKTTKYSPEINKDKYGISEIGMEQSETNDFSSVDTNSQNLIKLEQPKFLKNDENLIHGFSNDNIKIFEKNSFSYLDNITHLYFSEKEIDILKNLKKKFEWDVNNYGMSDYDQFCEVIIFFKDANFNKKLRNNYYEFLINFGFPQIEEYNEYYNLFVANCLDNKILIPDDLDKMNFLFYIEYIFKILTSKYIPSYKSELISKYFFGGEKLESIKKKLKLIFELKENSKINKNFITDYLNKNFDMLFKSSTQKLNEDFSKNKALLCKMISNLILKCNSFGYKEYPKIIEDEKVLFDGLKFRNENSSITESHKKQIISLQLFGKELTNNNFDLVIENYFTQLFPKDML